MSVRLHWGGTPCPLSYKAVRTVFALYRSLFEADPTHTLEVVTAPFRMPSGALREVVVLIRLSLAPSASAAAQLEAAIDEIAFLLRASCLRTKV